MIAENNKEKKSANTGGVIWGQMLLHAIRKLLILAGDRREAEASLLGEEIC